MMIGRTPDEGQEWLDEAETHSNKTNEGVGICVEGLG